MSEFHIRIGATAPAIEVIVYDQANQVVDVTGATIGFALYDSDGNAETLGGTAEVVDGPAGRIRYNWASGDTDTAGVFSGLFSIEYAAGPIEHVPTPGRVKVSIHALPD